MFYYLVGIKGAAMSALAKLLYDKGHIVSGVDVGIYFYTEYNLKRINIETFELMKLKKHYVYIIGNAYLNHSVTNYVKNMNYKYYTYPDFINYYFNNYKIVGVSGTHGKTTTTKILSTIIPNSSYIIGDGSGGGCGNEVLVLEACEYKNTFLNYNPNISLILNIDYDHPDFFKTKEDYYSSFVAFIKKSKISVINGDLIDLKIKVDNVITYGLKDKNDINFSYYIETNKTIIYILDTRLEIPYVGLHYVYDFVGAYIIAKLFNIHDKTIIERIKYFKLPKRRMEKITINQCLGYLDYAHHPTEIKCVYNTLKMQYKNRQLVVVFQPHTISRTKFFLDDFKDALSMFDESYILPIFSSVRETFSLKEQQELYEKMAINQIKDINQIVYDRNKIYVFLGAGDIDNMVKLCSKRQT